MKGLSKQDPNSDIEEAPWGKVDIAYGGTGMKAHFVWK